jgi:uncharacterized membrane-anchored protein
MANTDKLPVSSNDQPAAAAFRRARPVEALRVPAVGVLFWVIKSLSTAMGESTSDYLVHALDPVVAVLLGLVGFSIALLVQLRMRRYVAWSYWFAVVMVGVFGTMAADVMHVGFGVPYVVSGLLCAVALAAVFVSWGRIEGTLSIHSITTTRRELFYWAAVVTTFALGTAVGDVTALTFGLGYAGSILVFGAIMVVPVVGYRVLHWNSVFCFWFAYVVTRPLGASVADWLGKPTADGGLGYGSGLVAAALSGLILVLVTYLAITKRDVQPTVSSG